MEARVGYDRKVGRQSEYSAMQSDNQIDSLARETSTLATALQAGKTLGDILAVRLLAIDLWLRFAAEVSPQITTAQLERLIDSRIVFAQHNSPKLNALLNRPGIAPCFSRNGVGRRTPEVRRLPRKLRVAIARLPDNMLRLATYTTNLVSDSIIDIALLNNLDLSPEDAASLLQFNLPNIAVKNPEILSSLPEKVKRHLQAANATRVWFSKSHSLFAEFSGNREAIIIDIERAQGLTRLDLLKELQNAVDTRSTGAVRAAIRCLKSQLWFFGSSETAPLPKSDFFRYDGSLTLSAMIRHARKADILYDHGEYAIFDAAAEPGRRYFVRLPAYAAAFVSEQTEGSEEAYRAAPLRFVIEHSAERSKSQLILSLRTDLDRLESLRGEIGVAATADRLSERLSNLAKSGLAAVPQSAFAATAYLLVAQQLGFREAPQIAALEGFVHLLIAMFFRDKKDSGD